MENNTLIIFASPKENGYTARLLREAFPRFREYGFYNCYKNIPMPCTDCGLCKVKTECCFTDLDRFFNDFQKATNVIFAFPVYNGSVPSPLKSLIDRFQRFYNARFCQNIKPPMAGSRKVTLLITSGSGKNYTDDILKQFVPMFTISGCTLSAVYSLKGTDLLTNADKICPEIKHY